MQTFTKTGLQQLDYMNFIGGTYREILFYPYTSASAAITITGAESCYWTLAPYSQPDYIILQKQAEKFSTKFIVYLYKEDTIDLSGKYIQTVVVRSAGDDAYTYKVAQGLIDIIPAIQIEEDNTSAWWLPTGISEDECIAAFRPKGALSYTHSLRNLAHPKEHEPISIGQDPGWTSGSGWIFSGSNCFNTDINPIASSTTDYTIFVKFYTNFSLLTSQTYYLFGSRNYPSSNGEYSINYSYGAGVGLDTWWYSNFATYSQYPTLAATGSLVLGVMPVLSGDSYGYANATAYSLVANSSWASYLPTLGIGALHCRNAYYTAAEGFMNFFNGKIYALAIYKKEFTAAQASQLVTSMMAL